MSSFQIVAGKFIDVPPIQRQITHAEAEAQTLPIDYRNASTSPLESTSRTTQTDRIIGTPLSARQLRISSVVLERIISELTKVEEENSIFAELDAFHSRRSVRLVQFRGAAVETTEHLSICGVVSGSERRVAVLCGERVHTSWCLHTGRVVVIYGSQRHWTHLGSCPTVATFGPHGQLIVGTANGEISVLLEGESLWSSTQMHLQAMTSLRWLSSHMLLSAALDGRIVLSSVQAGALEPVKSSSVSVSDLPRTMKRNNSSALKVGIVSTTVSSNELFVATDTGAILQVDADTLEAKPIGYEIEGIEQLEMSAGRFVAVSASNEAKILERNGLTVEWLGLRNVITMTHNGRNIFVFLTSDEVVIIDGNTLQVMLREPTTVLAVNFDDTGNLIGVMANEKNKNRNHDFSFSLAPSYEEVSTICKEILDEVVGQKGYQHGEVVNWNQIAIEKITEKLVALNRPYKYCVCCVIMQTGVGAGLNVSSNCYWDKNNDTAFVYRWDNRAIIAICQVFAISLGSR